MKGWSIFTHSVSMVLRNFEWAVRIALVPVLIGIALIFVVLSAGGQPIAMFWDEQALSDALQSGKLGLSFVTATLIFIAVQFWVFVAWHRLILLEEYPTSWLPAFKGDRILSYFGHMLLIGFLVFVLFIPLMLLVNGLIAAMGSGALVPMLLVIAGYSVFVLIAMYRMLPVLPAVAIGRPLLLRESWQATSGASGTVFLVLVLLGVLQLLMQFVSGLSFAVFAPLGFVFSAFAMLAMSLVSASVLTTFYGHYVEGRPI
ncbi:MULTISPECIES: hypothetical protein [unclassified Leisingera]|uniref:hypothetical protein n=1 Tax=unclassified Leisingera TaxID=2614906 RepID=UPI00101145DB|nr:MULTISPECIES: hypothetical protein [unclassified Leisingera]MCF6429607.1 hypothetical protein [Leisingera sp. MMG026]QAX31454.1 hypothetical protein ETW24_19850 [Leisingera sp. NJS204]